MISAPTYSLQTHPPSPKHEQTRRIRDYRTTLFFLRNGQQPTRSPDHPVSISVVCKIEMCISFGDQQTHESTIPILEHDTPKKSINSFVEPPLRSRRTVLLRLNGFLASTCRDINLLFSLCRIHNVKSLLEARSCSRFARNIVHRNLSGVEIRTDEGVWSTLISTTNLQAHRSVVHQFHAASAPVQHFAKIHKSLTSTKSPVCFVKEVENPSITSYWKLRRGKIASYLTRVPTRRRQHFAGRQLQKI